ncbi:MAG TPA: hypothetical protein VNO81_05400 [Candidatus Nitrosotenuis sp.]|jgi:hypothetical protein|nr:hypothetical protein [Candidatus Nitrosotenuis sp.]
MLRLRFAVFLAVLAAAALPVRADLSESLKSQYHRPEELGIQIVTDDNLGQLKSILENPATRLLVLQAGPDRLTEEQAAGILDWVRAGHSVWFYDSRLAHWFGMKEYPLRGEQFRWQPETGDLGNRSTRGAAAVVLACGNHPVVTGVGQCTVFLPLVGEDLYSALEVAGDTVPLLQFAPDSPALAALRREGRGLVVFKPLLWPKAFSGERFQLNILEYSAGYPVPGPAGDGTVGHPPGPAAAYVVGSPAVPPAGSAARVQATPLPASEQASPLPVGAPSPGPTASAPGPGKNTPNIGSPGPKASAAPSPAATSLASTPPAPATTSAPASPPTADSPGAYPDLVRLASEGSLRCRVLLGNLRFETTSRSLTLDRQTVASIQIGQSLDLDRVQTRQGEKLSGFLIFDELVLEAQGGRRVVSKKDIVSIELDVP